VFAKNLPEPVTVELSINFNIAMKDIDVERFLQWADDPKSLEED
jgi:hypothetical protein